MMHLKVKDKLWLRLMEQILFKICMSLIIDLQQKILVLMEDTPKLKLREKRS